MHTTKSAISRYESVDYSGYGIPLLSKIAKACGAVTKGGRVDYGIIKEIFF